MKICSIVGNNVFILGMFGYYLQCLDKLKVSEGAVHFTYIYQTVSMFADEKAVYLTDCGNHVQKMLQHALNRRAV